MSNPIDSKKEPVRLQSTVTGVVAVVTAVVTGYGIDLPPEFAATLTAGVTAAVNGLMAKRTRAQVTPEANLPPTSDPLGQPLARPPATTAPVPRPPSGRSPL